jgi:hypothetical protein
VAEASMAAWIWGLVNSPVRLSVRLFPLELTGW